MHHRLLSILSLLVAVSGCSRGEAGNVVIAQIDTVGTRIEVANAGTPSWTDGTAWRLKEDLRLGTAEEAGSEVEQFGEVRSIASDSRGQIYIFDDMAQEIRVFSEAGVYSRSIGRRGRGPGEFSGAGELDIARGDTLVVLDDGLMRFSVFAPDGAFVKNRRREIVGTGAPLRSVLHDGSYLDWAPAFPDGRLGPRVFFYPVRYAPGLEHADTFPPIEYTQTMARSGRLPLMDFGGFVVASADHYGNLWFAISTEYRIYRRTLKGDTTLVLSLPVEARPLEEGDREYVRKRWSRRPQIRIDQLEALPEIKPVVYEIVPDNAGHILVFVDVAGEEPGTAVDVFRVSGEYLGRMVLPIPVPLAPNRPPVIHVTPEYLYVVVKDAMDAPYVSRLRIIKGQTPGEAARTVGTCERNSGGESSDGSEQWPTAGAPSPREGGIVNPRGPFTSVGHERGRIRTGEMSRLSPGQQRPVRGLSTSS